MAQSEVNGLSDRTMQEWQNYIFSWAAAKGWHDPERQFGDWTSLFHTELSEAYEDYRNHRRLNEVYFETDTSGVMKPCGIPVEMADIVIRIMHFCATYGISLNEMISMKMKYNETRPYRHGGKKQ